MKSAFLCSLLVLSTTLIAQNSVEIYTGTGICNVHNSNNGGTSDARMTYQFGGQYGILLAEKWQLKAGLEYANYGSRLKTSFGGLTYKSRYSSNYLEIPLTIGYRIGSDFVITPFISPKFGFNVLANNKAWIGDLDPVKDDYKDITKTFNFSASVGCELAKSIGSLEAFTLLEYRQGITSIFEDTAFSKDQNRFVSGRLTVGVRYHFMTLDKY